MASHLRVAFFLRPPVPRRVHGIYPGLACGLPCTRHFVAACGGFPEKETASSACHSVPAATGAFSPDQSVRRPPVGPEGHSLEFWDFMGLNAVGWGWPGRRSRSKLRQSTGMEHREGHSLEFLDFISWGRAGPQVPIEVQAKGRHGA